MNRIAGQAQSETARLAVVKILTGHFFAVGTKPGQIFYCRSADLTALKKFAPPQYRVFMKYRDHPTGEFKQGFTARIEIPVHPGDLVVLAITIIVALLRPAEFVAGE